MNRALGALGRTTLGDQAVGGGHDEILRRVAGQGGKGWERRRSISTFAGLDDVRVDYEDEDSEFAPVAGDVPVWDPTIETPFGGAWRPSASAGGGRDLFEASDSGSFDESTLFNFQQATPIDANSFQLVVVEAVAAPSDTLLAEGVELVSGGPVDLLVPTPWKLLAQDATAAPGVVHGQSNVGGYCQVSLWVHNDTDELAFHNIYMDVVAMTAAYPFSGTVEITVRTVYTPT